MIGCAFTVLNTLEASFLEKVYENALALELDAVGLSVAQQVAATVYYHDVVVGEYFVDPLVENVLLVELKTAKALDEAHRMQCVNYLEATGLRLCLLLNFGRPRLEIKRVWPTACDPRGPICVFCAHRLPSFALDSSLPCHKPAMRTDVGRNHNATIRACSIGQNNCS